MYDVAIIGAGPGGIAAAKRALQYGFKTALIEKNNASFGGTCLNKGCIPAKFFLKSSGIDQSWENVWRQNAKLIDAIKQPLLNYLKNQKLDIVWGEAFFVDEHTLRVNKRTVEAHSIIIATGSRPRMLVEGKNVLLAEDIFDCSHLPHSFLIIGAGYIGIELACIMHQFKKEVLIIEKEKEILPLFNTSLTRRLRKILEKKGIRFCASAQLKDYDLSTFDMVITAVGRQPQISSLNIEKAGVSLNEEGWIATDAFMKTNQDHIYALGDVTGKKLLAYAAEYQGRLCIDHIQGIGKKEDYRGVAECVFSLPQFARVGITEREAQQQDIPHKVIKSNFLKLSSAYVYGDTDGFIQVIVDEKDKIIGAAIISHAASELINFFSLCVRGGMRLGDLGDNVFIHPTLSEIIPLLARETQKSFV